MRLVGDVDTAKYVELQKVLKNGFNPPNHIVNDFLKLIMKNKSK